MSKFPHEKIRGADRASLGLGGVVISNGEVIRGQTNKAGQFCHILVLAKPDGRRCGCGKIGCLTTLASGSAIFDRLGLSMQTGENLEYVCLQGKHPISVLDCAENDDTEIIGILIEAVSSLGVYRTLPVTVLELDIVILTGLLVRNAVYCESLKDCLRAGGVTTRVVRDCDIEILLSTDVAADVTLSTYVFSPNLDIEPLLEAENATSVKKRHF